MKHIKDLTVTVNYRVGLGNLKVPDNVFEQLTEIADNGGQIDGSDTEYAEALEWMNDNIKESDAFDWQYEIDELSMK